MLYQHFPTQFAEAKAEAVGLLDKRSMHQATSLHSKLREFQSMALVCKYDECEMVYDDIELNEKQKESLMLIYSATKPFAKGFIGSFILDKATNGEGSADMMRLLVQLIDDPESVSDEKVQRLIVNLTHDKDK